MKLTVTANDPTGVARVVLHQCKPRCKVGGQDTRAPYQCVQKAKATGKVTYTVRAYDNDGNFTDKAKTIAIKPKKPEKRR